MPVGEDLSTPGHFLFGGCGLAAAIVALEAASERNTVWAAAQYLSYAPTGSIVDYEVTLAVVGGHVTQGRAVACVEDREILTVNAALGEPRSEQPRGVWVEPPKVPPPEQCPHRRLPELFTRSVLDRIDVRVAKGRMFDELRSGPGDPDSALWARVPGHLSPSAATLAIFGDYVSGSVSQPVGGLAMARSLDNTLRVAQTKPTDWVLCDIRIHALMHGYAQGAAHLWSEDGSLLATASQSMGVKMWTEGLPFTGR